MRSLVWTIWLALIFAIIGTLITSVLLVKQWTNYLAYSQLEGRPRYPLQALAIEIEVALNNGGTANEILLASPLNNFGEIYLLNPAGLDTLDRSLPKAFASTSDQSVSAPGPIFTQKIETAEGEIFSLIFRFDSPQPVWTIFKSLGLFWVLLTTLVISGIISWLLAVMILRPLRLIAEASDLDNEHDILNKIDPQTLNRRDEIGELARHLKAAGVQIANLLQKQKDFLRDVSHEVRTPLARLQIASETLELDPDDHKAVSQIKSEVLVIDQLVQDLLHLSHFDRPAQSRDIETIDFLRIVELCVERSRILADSRDIKLQIESSHSNGMKIEGVGFLMDRALDNLLTNAIRYSPQNSTVRVITRREKEYCSLEVWDQGEGVEEDSVEDIFEPFFRTDSSRNRSTGGFGLGLPLVKKIMELHSGTVAAANEDSGFVVRLKMPLKGIRMNANP